MSEISEADWLIGRLEELQKAYLEAVPMSEIRSLVAGIREIATHRTNKEESQ
jgi:hypothetical protein